MLEAIKILNTHNIDHEEDKIEKKKDEDLSEEMMKFKEQHTEICT